jgi:hypothetical protein
LRGTRLRRECPDVARIRARRSGRRHELASRSRSAGRHPGIRREATRCASRRRRCASRGHEIPRICEHALARPRTRREAADVARCAGGCRATGRPSARRARRTLVGRDAEYRVDGCIELAKRAVLNLGDRGGGRLENQSDADPCRSANEAGDRSHSHLPSALTGKRSAFLFRRPRRQDSPGERSSKYATLGRPALGKTRLSP